MNGKLLLITPGGTLIIVFFLLVFLTSPRFFKHSSTMCWEIWQISSSMSTWMTYWYFLILSRNMFSMSGECFRDSYRMSFLSRQRYAFFMHSLFLGIHCLSRGSAHGFREGSGCYELANPRFPQGPAEVSGLCQFFTMFYSQLQSASRSFDCLNLHQDCLQVVQGSGCCILQIQKALFQLPSLLPLIRPGSLWWRLMRQRWGLTRLISQRSLRDGKVHHCTYFSHRLSPAECNYNVGNRELLAVKLALVEWCHWLEGSGVPFVVWTDHKNLEYIKSAKRLHFRHAQWALFSVI